jgi:hypothetical protein
MFARLKDLWEIEGVPPHVFTSFKDEMAHYVGLVIYPLQVANEFVKGDAPTHEKVVVASAAALVSVSGFLESAMLMLTVPHFRIMDSFSSSARERDQRIVSRWREAHGLAPAYIPGVRNFPSAEELPREVLMGVVGGIERSIKSKLNLYHSRYENSCMSPLS